MKRRLAKLVVFPLLGAIVNVAVAWGYAMWSEPTEKTGSAAFCRAGFGYLDEWNEHLTFSSDGLLLLSYSTSLEGLWTGWPCLAIGIDDHVVVPESMAWLYRETQQHIPLRPIFPGFAINTIFYAAILWLLFAAPGTIRRRLRIRRGLCPACAYPAGDSAVCSECGKPVSPKNVETVA